MYFDFEDYRPDIPPVGRAISWREGVLLSIIVHLVRRDLRCCWSPTVSRSIANAARRARPLVAAAGLAHENRRDSSSCSRASTGRRRSRRNAPTCPTRIVWRDRASRPKADRPAAVLARQFTASAIETSRATGRESAGTAAGSGTERQEPQKADAERESQPKLPESPSSLQFPVGRRPRRPQQRPGAAPGGGRWATRCATCSATCRPGSASTTRRAAAQFGPEIQFDTKGVEFGPWIRRFIAQVSATGS